MLSRLRATRSLRRAMPMLALLALAIRALVPTGYMLAPVAGHLSLVFCPATYAGGDVALPAAGNEHQLHHHHDSQLAGATGHEGHEGHAGHAAHAALENQHCPFALANGTALLAQSAGSSETYYIVLQPARLERVDSSPAAPPLRHRSPRGPPSLA